MKLIKHWKISWNTQTLVVRCGIGTRCSNVGAWAAMSVLGAAMSVLGGAMSVLGTAISVLSAAMSVLSAAMSVLGAAMSVLGVKFPSIYWRLRCWYNLNRCVTELPILKIWVFFPDLATEMVPITVRIGNNAAGIGDNAAGIGNNAVKVIPC